MGKQKHNKRDKKSDKKCNSIFKVKPAQFTKAKKNSKDAKMDLKKLKVSGRPSVETADEVFSSLHAKLIQKKTVLKTPQDSQKQNKVKKEMVLGESVNIEETVQDFAKL